MPNKYPSPEFIAKMNNSNRRRFIYEFLRGDGTSGCKLPDLKKICRNRDLFRGTKTPSITQKNTGYIDSLQMIASLVGLPTSVKQKGHIINFLKLNRKSFQIEWMQKEEIVVPGVWCPTTTTGTWICRQAGRVYITGNSDPQDAFQHIVAAYSRMVKPKPKRDMRPTHMKINRQKPTYRIGIPGRR
ncbi:MAG: hypothetical protein DRP51_10690, partial [Candidatus Zixiibacteriota bacterium]